MSKISIVTPKNDYTGGEVVEGQIVVELDDPLPVRGVRLRCQGVECARWRNGTGREQLDKEETKVLFDSVQTLFGRPSLAFRDLLKDAVKGVFSKEHYEILDAGAHEYPFVFELPPSLPADYESPRGSRIRYTLTAEVDVPLRVDLTTTTRLTIYEPIDDEPGDPVATSSCKTFLFDAEAPLEVKVALPQGVFFPGDKTRCTVTITNRSQKRIDAINLMVRQTENLAAMGDFMTHHYDVPIADVTEFDRKPGEPVEVQVDVQIPEDLYGTISSSSLVKVSYAMVVNLDVPWALDLQASVPIELREKAGAPSGATKGT